MKNKRGQFYLVATIIIVGLIVGLAVTYNYSAKDNSDESREIADELRIEGEKVIDYDTMYPTTPQFENFARDYSAYAGEDKEIYFILVKDANKEAYKYTGGIKQNFSSSVNVTGDIIKFALEEEVYNFELEDGNNFYFVITHEEGGEKYVFSG